jgi:hypothetical protein
MGGAYVAVADDPTAVYWNPAGLSLNQTRAVTVAISAAGADPKGAIDDVKSLVDMNLAAHGRIITPADISRALGLLESLAEPGNGVDGEANVDVMVKYGDYAFSVLNLGTAEAVPVIDLDILNFDPNSGQPLPADLPKLDFTGVLTKQYVGTYAVNILENAIWAGVNLKYIQADTYYASRPIVDPQNKALKLRDLVNEAKGVNKRTNSKFGIDIGVLGSLTKNLYVGLVGRDMNGPELKNVGPWKAKLNPQYRLGASYRIGEFVTVATDYDLSKNDVGIPGVQERELSIGGEGRLLSRHLAIRGGMSRNIDVEKSKWLFAFGIGFDSAHAGIDVAGVRDRGSNQIGGAISGTIRF